jgi:hypothetical protein
MMNGKWPRGVKISDEEWPRGVKISDEEWPRGVKVGKAKQSISIEERKVFIPSNDFTEIIFYLLNTETTEFNPFMFYGIYGDPSIYNWDILLGKYITLSDKELPEYLRLSSNTYTRKSSLIVVLKALKENQVDSIGMIRKPLLPSNPNCIPIENKYIHDDAIAFDCLKEHYREIKNGQHYGNIQSFQFISVHPNDSNEAQKKIIQDMINEVYPIAYMNNKNGFDVLSKHIVALKEMFQSHAISEVEAKYIINDMAEKASELLIMLNRTDTDIDIDINSTYNIPDVSAKDMLKLYLIQLKNQNADNIGKNVFVHAKHFDDSIGRLTVDFIKEYIICLINAENEGKSIEKQKECYAQHHIVNHELLTKLLYNDIHMILSRMSHYNKYINIPNIIIEPWIERNWRLGNISWNKLYNLAYIERMIANNNPDESLFFIKLLLNTHPQWVKHSDVNITNLQFVGFFIVRYDNDTNDTNLSTYLTNYELEIPNTNEFKKILRRYDIHLGKEPYEVFCVYSKTDKYTTNLDDLIIVNTFCKMCERGYFRRRKSWLYMEITQLLSSCFKEQQEIQLYVLLPKKEFNEEIKATPKDNLLKKICEDTASSQLDTISKCMETWFSVNALKILIENNIGLTSNYTENNDIEILASKVLNIRDIFTRLNDKKQEDERIEINVCLLRENGEIIDPNIEYINIKLSNGLKVMEYNLLPIYMAWGVDVEYCKNNSRHLIELGTQEILRNKITDYKEEEDMYFKYSDIFSQRNRHDAIRKNVSDSNYQKIIANYKKKEQEGGTYNNKYYNIIKKIKKQVKLMDIILQNDKIKNNNEYIAKNRSMTGYILSTNKKAKIYYESHYQIINKRINDNNIVLNLDNFKLFADVGFYISPTNILIIAQNIYFATTCLDLFKHNLNKIILILINIEIIDQLIRLIEKYISLIDIYIISSNITIESYNTINEICNNNKFDTIIIDYGGERQFNNILSIMLLIFSYLIIYNYLSINGNFIFYNILYELHEKQNILLNFIYDMFNKLYHRQFRSYYFKTTIHNLYIYEDYSNNTNNLLYNKLFKLFTDLSKIAFMTDFYKIFNDFINDYKLSSLYIENIIHFYYNYYIKNKFFIKKLVQKCNIKLDKTLLKNMNVDTSPLLEKININNNIFFTSNKLLFNVDIKKIPLYIYDITLTDDYKISNLVFPIYNNINKSYLMSDIEFLTLVSKEIVITDYVVIYLGCYNLPHIKILMKLFQVNKWLLFDEQKFSFKLKNKPNIIINNKILNINIINKLKKEYPNIIFICNNNHTVYNSKVHLVNNLKIAIELNAKYILLNSRFPINQLNDIKHHDIDYFIGSINDLHLNDYKDSFLNYDLSTNKDDELLYIKGEILLPLYQDNSDYSFRLMIRQNKNKYELEIYNLDKIHKLLNYYIYNNHKFIFFNDKDIVYPLNITINVDYFKLLIGYDGSMQNLMEFAIINRYLYNIKKTNNEILTFKLIHDINKRLEKYTKSNILDFNYNKKIFEYGYIWKNILRINRYNSAQIQYNIIKHNEIKYSNIFGSKRIKNILSKLLHFITNNTFNYYLLTTG